MNKALPILVATLLPMLSAGAARAVELQGGLGLTAYGSSWRGDVGGGGMLHLGVRFSRVIALDFLGWESLARVDRRVNTGLTFGVVGYLPREGTRPFARLFAIHQHEEGLVSVEASPATVALGIGAGIRHRVGVGLSLGAAVPVTNGERSVWSVTPRATAIFLPDPLGPKLYFGVESTFGFDMVL